MNTLCPPRPRTLANASSRRTARVYLRPVVSVPASEALLVAAPQPVASDALGDMCRQATELEAARRREEESRRQAAEAARARFAAD